MNQPAQDPVQEASASEEKPAPNKSGSDFQFPVAVRELKAALPALKRLARSSSSLKTLSTVLVERDKGETLFTATNLDQRLTFTIPSITPAPASELGKKLLANQSAREDGSMCVPVVDLTAALKNADRAGDIVFTSKELRYKFGGNVATIEPENLTADEFPELAHRNPSSPVLFPDSTKNAIIACLPNASDDTTRYVIVSVFLDVAKQDVVATDGRSLTSFHTPIPLDKKFKEKGVIVHKEAVELLADRQIAKSAWTVSIGKDTIQIVAGQFTVRSKLVEGNYPNWIDVVPKIDDKTQIKIPLTMYSRPEISSLLKRLPKNSSSTNDPVQLGVNKERLKFSANGASFEIGTLTNTTKPRCTNANRNFWQRAVDLQATELRFVDELSPIAARNRNGMTFVFMPVRIGEPLTTPPSADK